MNIKDIKEQTVFKVTGGEGGYWLYTGKYQHSDFPCEYCKKRRSVTYEFLHYEKLETIQTNKGGFDNTKHFGSECIKYFAEALDAKNIVQ